MMSETGAVRTGLDRLVAQPTSLAGKRIGLVTNAAAVTGGIRWAGDALQEAGIRLTALFTPEHGLYAAAADGAGVTSFFDEDRQFWVYSLYGRQNKPDREQLEGVDVLLYDIPDVGARFYTYIWTLSLAIEACGETGTPLWVLDRPNPIGGSAIEGAGVAPGFESFVGRASIPIRHGWTSGEFARWYNDRFQCGADLTVLWAENWSRAQWWDQTGLPWVSPSPAMATLATAAVYPGMCLFEGVNVSEGRGTSHPFEWVGAPWADERAVASRLNDAALPGVVFRALRFEPTSGPLREQVCRGVQVHITDRARFRPLHTGVCVLAAFMVEDPESFAWNRWRERYGIDRLWGDDTLRTVLSQARDPFQTALEWDTRPPAELEQAWLRYHSPAYAG